MGGKFERPICVRRWAYYRATTRVDSRLKLTFGQLVNKSTYDYLVVGAWLW